VLMTVLMCWCVDDIVSMCWCVDDVLCVDVLMCWCVDVLMCWWLCWCVDRSKSSVSFRAGKGLYWFAVAVRHCRPLGRVPARRENNWCSGEKGAQANGYGWCADGRDLATKSDRFNSTAIPFLLYRPNPGLHSNLKFVILETFQMRCLRYIPSIWQRLLHFNASRRESNTITITNTTMQNTSLQYRKPNQHINTST